MGWTPLEGLMMGTRAGSIDPGILVRLLADGRLSRVDELAEALDHGAGLLAVAGTADMRDIVLRPRAMRGDERAALALAMFVRRVAAGDRGGRHGAATAATRSCSRAASASARGRARGGDRGAAAARGRAGPARPTPLDDDARPRPRRMRPVAVLRVAAREDLVIARETATGVDSLSRSDQAAGGLPVRTALSGGPSGPPNTCP